MRFIKLLITSVLIFGILSCEFPGKKEKEGTGQDTVQVKSPTPVEGILVTRGLVSHEVRASGVTAGINESYVVSETKGKIEQVNFSLGQWVEKGKTLVKVNDVIQFAAFEQAKKGSAAAELNLKVTRRLFNDGNASDAELTNAQSQATGAKAQFESAQKAYRDCRIKAPVSGYVAQKELTIEKGNVLGGGTLVARIVNISSLKATVSVGEMEIGILKKGMPVQVKVPAVGNKLFKGKVAAIAAGSNPATGSYPVEIVWKNTRDRAIKSGMSVRVTITTQERDSTILIPLTTLVKKDAKDAVFIASEDRAILRFVTTGRATGNLIEIYDGITVGEVLVTTGMTNLSRGEHVSVTLPGESGATQ